MMDEIEYNDMANETIRINNSSAKKYAEVVQKQMEILIINERVFHKLDKWLDLEIAKLENDKKEIPNE